MRKTTAPCPDEHAEQTALCQWWAMYSKGRGIPEKLLFAIPNGGRRDAVTGARLKAEGVRAGMPDLMLAWPVEKSGRAGLFVEMKKQRGGKVSPEQAQMLEHLQWAGYAVAVCCGWDEAKAEIEKYLGVA